MGAFNEENSASMPAAPLFYFQSPLNQGVCRTGNHLRLHRDALKGSGMNVIINITRVSNPMILILGSRGDSQYNTGGCLMPRMSISKAQTSQPSHPEKPSNDEMPRSASNNTRNKET